MTTSQIHTILKVHDKTQIKSLLKLQNLSKFYLKYEIGIPTVSKLFHIKNINCKLYYPNVSLNFKNLQVLKYNYKCNFNDNLLKHLTQFKELYSEF